MSFHTVWGDNVKIGLYLQDTNVSKKNTTIFDKAMDDVIISGLDLLVFPEFCYTPFAKELYHSSISSEEGFKTARRYCIELSEYLGCAIIFSSKDKDGLIYSIYANGSANGDETSSKIYIKHTATDFSAFDLDSYHDTINTMFEPIIYKDKRLGMTICYDCNHAAFSRAFGKSKIDILINSTGGNIVYDKWHKYNKVRAIENNCFNFCTMGYVGRNKQVNSYVFGYSPNGKSMNFTNLTSKSTDRNIVGSIYVYDTDSDNGDFDVDSSLDQTPTTNRFEGFFFPCSRADELIANSKKIDKDLYIYPSSTDNIVLCVIKDKEILESEKILHLIYNKSLKNIKNKRYIIINQWEHLDEDLYKYQISEVLKVRSMENYCAVILESDSYNKCYQCGKNRTAQVVKDVNGKYGIDVGRTNGPETIWKNKDGMRASWRSGFEELLNYLVNK
jgi:predicted amidohydrolase